MGDVPDAHLETSLVLAEPVCHDPSARRPAEAAQPADDQHECEYDCCVHGGVRSERDDSCKDHGERGEDKPHAKEFPRVGSVRHAAHDELGESVGDRHRRHRQSGLSRVNDPVVDHVRRCQRKILTYKIIGRIAEKRTQEDFGAHRLVGFVHFILSQWFTRLGRIKKS